MNRDDIIRMAREAGLHLATDHDWMPIIALAYAQKFADLVAETEREAIKNLIEQIKNDWEKDGDRLKVYASEYILSAIRARGQ